MIITDDQARVHPDKNIITRAVGAFQDIEADFFEAGLRLAQRAGCDCFYDIFDCISGSKIPCIMSAHSICNDEKIWQVSDRGLRCIDIVLICYY